MKKGTLFILAVLFLTNGLNAQYYLEHLHRWDEVITKFVKLPKPTDAQEFKKYPVVFVKQEITEDYLKAIKKQYKGKKKVKGDEIIAQQEIFVKRYNQTLEEVIKLYPYDVDAKIVSMSEYENIDKNDVHAFVKIKHRGYLTAGITGKKETNHFAIPIPLEMYNEEYSMEVEMKFFIQRMENYIKRMAKGSKASRKIYAQCKKELNDRLKSETKKRTLLIDKRYLAEGIKKKDLSKILDMKFELVDKETIDEQILNPSGDFWYVKIVPYQGFSRSSTKSFNSQKQSWSSGPSRTSRFTVGAHYIIDPTDGSAMLVNFMLSPDIDKNALKKYNSDLKSTKLSLRD